MLPIDDQRQGNTDEPEQESTLLTLLSQTTEGLRPRATSAVTFVQTQVDSDEVS